MKKVVVALVVLATLACNEPKPKPIYADKATLEKNIAEQANKYWDDNQMFYHTNDVSCISETDRFHFICIVRTVPQVGLPASSYTVKAICDSSGGCIWRQE